MVIRISLGNVGSGKTACEVRNFFHNPSNRITYSNIMTKKLPNIKKLTPDLIFSRDIIKTKKKRNGETEPVYKLSVNFKFWRELTEPCNVVLDEAHSILNSRRAMSKTNVIISDWISLIRRVIGENSSGAGEFVLISQLSRRLDPIVRDMAHQIKYHTCHYQKTCRKCSVSWSETSEIPEPLWRCPVCNSSKILKHSHKIEVQCFANIDSFTAWKEWGVDKGMYSHYFISDIEDYFPYYNTLQWDNMFMDFY